MKIWTFFLVSLFILGAASCNMEKRLYRNGWYKAHASGIDKKAGTHSSVEAAVAAGRPDSSVVAVDSVSVVPVRVDPAANAHASAPNEKPLEKIRKIWSEGPLRRKNPMSYAEARLSMEQKGCKPNTFVQTIYVLSVISVALSWIGLGIFLALITLLLSLVAMNSALASSCPEENVAILQAGQRICAITLAIFLLASLLIVLLILSILYYFD